MSPEYAALSLKIYILYVHRHHTQFEISEILGVGRDKVFKHLKMAAETSKLLKKEIAKRAKANSELVAERNGWGERYDR